MQQDNTAQSSGHEDATSVTLLPAQREVGLTRGTLKNHGTPLEIEPMCFPIGTRSLSISQEAMALIARLKHHPALFAHVPNASVAQGHSARKET